MYVNIVNLQGKIAITIIVIIVIIVFNVVIIIVTIVIIIIVVVVIVVVIVIAAVECMLRHPVLQCNYVSMFIILLKKLIPFNLTCH